MDLPALQNPHAIAVLLLVLIAFFLFSRERIPLQTSSLIVLVLLAAGFELFPYASDGKEIHAIDFFHGFGHEALIAVCALMIAGQGLIRTGALEPVGRMLSQGWKSHPQLSLLFTLLLTGLLSAFVNNTPIVVLMLPILISVALKTRTPASSILMPMGFATLIGGMSTTIGTSTNLLVVAVAADQGMQRLQIFDFFLPAVIAGSIGMVYLWLVAPRLLPHRETSLENSSPRIFTAQLKIEKDSFAEGKTLSEIIEKAGGDIKVKRIQREDGTVIMPLPDARLRAGDQLRVSDRPENLKEFESALGATLYSGDTLVNAENPLADENQQIAEVVVVQGSPLEGRTLSNAYFTHRYQLTTLALHRAGTAIDTINTRVTDLKLRIGDVILVQGASEQISEIKRRSDLMVLDATADLPHSSKAPLALFIMAAIIITAALGIFPIAISAVVGVALILITGCIDWRDATQALSAPVIMIVVASLALGMAMLNTGGADYLAELFLAITFGASPVVVLSGLMLLMAVLTNIVSNNAAAVVGTPIAIEIARQLNVPAEPFVLAVLFGANMSYATPMAYKTNLLVMNAGGYKFSDFMRVGIPLTLIMWLTYSVLLPIFYDLG